MTGRRETGAFHRWYVGVLCAGAEADASTLVFRVVPGGLEPLRGKDGVVSVGEDWLRREQVPVSNLVEVGK
jgi:hypothetical protein